MIGRESVRTRTGVPSELVVVHAIEQKVVVGDAQAVYRNGFVSALILKDATADVGPGLATIGSRSKIGELDKISSVQRQLGNAPLGFDRAPRSTCETAGVEATTRK